MGVIWDGSRNSFNKQIAISDRVSHIRYHCLHRVISYHLVTPWWDKSEPMREESAGEGKWIRLRVRSPALVQEALTNFLIEQTNRGVQVEGEWITAFCHRTTEARDPPVAQPPDPFTSPVGNPIRAPRRRLRYHPSPGDSPDFDDYLPMHTGSGPTPWHPSWLRKPYDGRRAERDIALYLQEIHTCRYDCPTHSPTFPARRVATDG